MSNISRRSPVLMLVLLVSLVLLITPGSVFAQAPDNPQPRQPDQDEIDEICEQLQDALDIIGEEMEQDIDDGDIGSALDWFVLDIRTREIMDNIGCEKEVAVTEYLFRETLVHMEAAR